jgi:hypothetical protein
MLASNLVQSTEAQTMTTDESFKVGDKVRHADGTLGTVTSVDGETVHWKYCGHYRFSNVSMLTRATDEPRRWRK